MWVLVPRHSHPNVVCSMWLFKHKFHADGSLSRYKVCLVANGRSQIEGIDCDEKFSSFIKPATIYIVLSLALSHDWLIHQLDVKNAFLHGSIRVVSAFASYATWVGFYHNKSDSTLFIFHRGSKTAYLLIYVDDIILTTSSSALLQRVISLLQSALQYLTFTRTDITYAFQHVYLFMHDPREPHFAALKRILRYVHGTLDYGLQLYAFPTTHLTAYSDADWAGFSTTRRSTSGYCVFLGDNLLSWSSKRQCTISRSSAEAEYSGVANVIAEIAWIQNLLLEPHASLQSATLIYYDNVSAIYMSSNPVHHQRTKHIEIDILFVRDKVATSHVCVLHVPSRYQYADIFTKGLPSSLFIEFQTSLSNLLLEPHASLQSATLIYYDNVSAIYMSSNPVHHQRTKHIEIDILFVRDKVATSHVCVLHVPSRYQYADIFTKGLPSSLFIEFQTSLSVRHLPLKLRGCISQMYTT
nr:ribonuclease H-like domain-containing protein [Tanacetum cinerariifolium]